MRRLMKINKRYVSYAVENNEKTRENMKENWNTTDLGQ